MRSLIDPAEAALMPVRFDEALSIAKHDVFEMCSTMAEAQQALYLGGQTIVASQLSELIEVIEGRLAGRGST